jgi:hypothetical protein
MLLLVKKTAFRVKVPLESSNFQYTQTYIAYGSAAPAQKAQTHSITFSPRRDWYQGSTLQQG